MADLTRAELLENPLSPNGRGVSVAATSSPGTEVYRARSGLGQWDVVTLELSNVHTGSVTVTIQWGGTDTADQSKLVMATNTSVIWPDRRLINGGLPVRVFATVAGVINVFVSAQGYPRTAWSSDSTSRAVSLRRAQAQ